jgi:hypothetical protein
MGRPVLSQSSGNGFNRVMASVLHPIRTVQAGRIQTEVIPDEDVRDILNAAHGSALRLSALLKPAEITAVLLNYAYLQLLDLLSTGAFLLAGVQEANPLVVMAMKMAANPLIGVAAVKAFALGLGFYCWWTGRGRLLKMATAFYAVLVAYNLICLILALGAR